MNSTEVSNYITKLKHSQEKVYSNCFMQFNKEQDWETLTSSKSLCIIKREYGANRLWFYTIDFDDLNFLIRNCLDSNDEFIVDILTKEKTFLKKNIEQLGFVEYTKMMRLSCSDISLSMNNNSEIQRYYNPNIGIKAGLDDAVDVFKKMWEIFDTRISHLQTIDELKESIRRGEIYIQRNNNGEVAAFLQRILEPKRFYINQIYNGMQKEIIHAILLNELRKYNNNGGKYVYAWVEEKNIASHKFHEKYGLKHDGLWNVVYRIKGIC